MSSTYTCVYDITKLCWPWLLESGLESGHAYIFLAVCLVTPRSFKYIVTSIVCTDSLLSGIVYWWLGYYCKMQHLARFNIECHLHPAGPDRC